MLKFLNPFGRQTSQQPANVEENNIPILPEVVRPPRRITGEEVPDQTSITDRNPREQQTFPSTRSTIKSPVQTKLHTFYNPKRSFFGRVEDLKRINNQLRLSSHLTDALEQRIVVLYGPNGVGKSELSRKYAESFLSHYSYIFWINASNLSTLSDSFVKLATRLKPPRCKYLLNKKCEKDSDTELNYSEVKEIATDVYNHLFSSHKISDNNGLFIFDDAQNMSCIRDFLPKQIQQQLLFLMTSPTIEWDIAKENIISVDKLSMDESDDFLYRELQLNYYHRDRKEITDSVEFLSNRLNGFSLGLSLASACIQYDFLADTKEKLENYLRLTEDLTTASRLWQQRYNPEGEAYINKSVINTVLKITLERIKDEAGNQGGKCVELLYLLSYMSPHDITIETVIDIFDYVKKDKRQYSQMRGNHQAKETDPRTVLRTLQSLAVIFVEMELSAKGTDIPCVRIHPLIQMFIREQLNREKNPDYLLQVANYFIDKVASASSSRTTSSLILIHEFLKAESWPDESIYHSLRIFGSLFQFKKWSDDHRILFQILVDVKAYIKSRNISPRMESDSVFRLHEEYANLLHLGLLLYRKSHGDHELFRGADLSQDAMHRCFRSAVESYFYDSWGSGSPGAQNETKIVQRYCYKIVEAILGDPSSLSPSDQSNVGHLIVSSLKENTCGRLNTIRKMFKHLWDYQGTLGSPAIYFNTLQREHIKFMASDQAASMANYWTDDCPIPMSKLIIRSHELIGEKKKDFLDAFVTEGCLDILHQHLQFLVDTGNNSYSEELIHIFELLTILAYDGQFAPEIVRTNEIMEYLKTCMQFDAEMISNKLSYDWEGRYSCTVLWFALFASLTSKTWSILSVKDQMWELYNLLLEGYIAPNKSSLRDNKTQSNMKLNRKHFFQDIEDVWKREGHKEIIDAFFKSHDLESGGVAFKIADHLLHAEWYRSDNDSDKTYNSTSSS